MHTMPDQLSDTMDSGNRLLKYILFPERFEFLFKAFSLPASTRQQLIKLIDEVLDPCVRHAVTGVMLDSFLKLQEHVVVIWIVLCLLIVFSREFFNRIDAWPFGDGIEMADVSVELLPYAD